MPSPSAEPTRRPAPGRWHAATAWLILVGSLLATAGATRAVAQAQAARDRAHFDEYVASMTRHIDRRMASYRDLVQHAGAFWLASPGGAPSVGTWRRYVGLLELPTRYPGIQGVAIALRVDAPGSPTGADLAARLHREGLAGWRIWPAGSGVERFPVVVLDPLDRRNAAAIGFDLATEATRREAMARARDTGEPALSGRLTLKQEIAGAKQPGFLLFVPLYRDGLRPADVAARRAALVGFAAAPFRAGDLFAGIFRNTAFAGLGYRVYDGERPDPGRLLVEHPAPPGPGAARLAATTPLRIAGRPWYLEAWTPADFPFGSSPLAPLGVALGGLTLGLALFAWVRALASSRDRALALADQMTAELRAADRAKDEFLSVISHELRTPLNFITGFTSLLADEVAGPLSPEQRRFVDRIDLGADRMLALVNDLLDAAKMSAGRFEVTRAPHAYPPLVAEAVASLRPLAEAKGLALEVAIAPEVAATTFALDGARVVQVLMNLLSNAVKFTPPGGRIVVRAGLEGAMLRTEVADTGIGIAPAEQARLFEAFRQVDMSATREAGGTGLGLAICKALVEAHGGAIGVRSRRDAGATFWFTLPAEAPAEA